MENPNGKEQGKEIDQFFKSADRVSPKLNLPILKNPTSDEITLALYSKIPKWLLAALAAMGKESQAIEELTDLTAEAFAQGYTVGVNDTMNRIREIIENAKANK